MLRHSAEWSRFAQTYSRFSVVMGLGNHTGYSDWMSTFSLNVVFTSQ